MGRPGSGLAKRRAVRTIRRMCSSLFSFVVNASRVFLVPEKAISLQSSRRVAAAGVYLPKCSRCDPCCYNSPYNCSRNRINNSSLVRSQSVLHALCHEIRCSHSSLFSRTSSKSLSQVNAVLVFGGHRSSHVFTFSAFVYAAIFLERQHKMGAMGKM